MQHTDDEQHKKNDRFVKSFLVFAIILIILISSIIYIANNENGISSLKQIIPLPVTINDFDIEIQEPSISDILSLQFSVSITPKLNLKYAKFKFEIIKENKYDLQYKELYDLDKNKEYFINFKIKLKILTSDDIKFDLVEAKRI